MSEIKKNNSFKLACMLNLKLKKTPTTPEDEDANEPEIEEESLFSVACGEIKKNGSFELAGMLNLKLNKNLATPEDEDADEPKIEEASLSSASLALRPKITAASSLQACKGCCRISLRRRFG